MISVPKKIAYFLSCLIGAFILFSSHLSYAQSVSFNIPKGKKEDGICFFTKGDSLTVEVTYEQKRTMSYHKAYLFIDRKNHLGKYEEYENKKIWLDLSPTANTTLQLTENGDYAISYANHKKEILATDTLHLEYDQSVFFCKELDENNKPKDLQNTFQCTKSGLSYYYMIMKSNQIFDTHKLFTKIYLYKVGDYRSPISEHWEYVNPDWKQVAFRGPFLKPGQYRIEVSKANGEPFATGYFKLNPYIAEESNHKLSE